MLLFFDECKPARIKIWSWILVSSLYQIINGKLYAKRKIALYSMFRFCYKIYLYFLPSDFKSSNISILALLIISIINNMIWKLDDLHSQSPHMWGGHTELGAGGRARRCHVLWHPPQCLPDGIMGLQNTLDCRKQRRMGWKLSKKRKQNS